MNINMGILRQRRTSAVRIVVFWYTGGLSFLELPAWRVSGFGFEVCIIVEFAFSQLAVDF